MQSKSDNTYDCKSLTLTTFPKVPSPKVANTLSEKTNHNNNQKQTSRKHKVTSLIVATLHLKAV